MNKLLMKNQNLYMLLSMFVCLFGSSVEVWADYNTWLRGSTDDTGKGLVYTSKTKDQTPTDDQYGEMVLSELIQGSNGAKQSFYGWAKPARGYSFATWTGYKYVGDDAKASEKSATFPSPKQATGVGDLIYAASWNGGAGDDAAGSVKASWSAATSYDVVYEEPVGGSYTVDYSYTTINDNTKFETSTEKLELVSGSGNKKPFGIPDGSQDGLSYAADVVTLSTSASYFIGWYEDGIEKSTANPYIYPITKSAKVTALFKWIEPIAPKEKLIRTTNNSANVDETVVFSMENIVSEWTTTDFTVTLENATGSGSFTIGDYSYNSTNKELTIPFTYNANGKWDEGSSVNIQVAPVNGTTVSVRVLAIAQQNSAHQARVSGDGITTQEGDLNAMLAIANEHTDATLTLLQSVAVSEPLVVSKSMTLDLNNWILSSAEADRIISIEGTDTKLIIADNSFLKNSAIQLTRSTNDTIAAIEVTGANKLLYNCGKMTVANNADFASNADAKAFGIYVSGAGNAVMQGGSINVTSDRFARGVFIATTTGNATLNVGKIEAMANVYAMAVYSGGKLNIGEGISLAATATDNWAAPLYILSGTAVVDYVTMTSSSATNNAYGVYSKAGTLTLNGCTITATAATPSVYGVYIAKSGIVTIQQQADITAEYTTTAVAGSATLQAYGIQNLGTVKVVNSNVTAISPANYATAVNTVTSAKTTTIDGGTYTAQTATGAVFGLSHQYGTLSVDGGTFTATATGNTVYGVYTKVNGTIKNATIIAETIGSGKNVYGAMCAAKTLTLTNCTITAKSATSGAYAIYNNATVNATGCTLNAKTLSSSTACGFHANKGAAVLTNTDATVDAFTTAAYGIYLKAGTLTVDGGIYDVTANQATATKAADTQVYGVFVNNGLSATLENATFNVSATNGSFSQKAYGAYTGTGTINTTSCTYSVSAAKQAYGVYGAASSTLNLKNNKIEASTIGSTTALGVYSEGNFTVDGDNITTNTKSYTSYPLYFKATTHGEVLGGMFMAKGTSTKSSEIIAPINTDALAENVQVKGGFFSDNVRLRYYVPDGYDIYGVDPAAPEYAEQYYYTVNDHVPYENICYITEKNVGFPTLEEAFDYARNHSDASYNIIMTQPYTLPAGNYSLPSNATLVVPDRVSRTTAIGTVAERQFPEQDLITENRCLTFAEGVNLDVYGTIEVSAKQYTTNVGRIAYVLGPYGRIHLENGSTVTLNNGAKINAWGYITGAGEIRVKNGAEVREFFQVHDMKAASAIPDWTSSDNKSTYKAFLMNQYYIQSIEAPTKYYYGGKLIGSLSITSNATAWTSVDADNVQLVAPSDAFFTVDTDDESSWVRKTYNPTTDRLLWETNSSASLGSISVSMMSYGFDSKDFVLPFTNNMTVHALSGIFNITQSAVLLPGCEVIVDKTATLHINKKDVNGDDMGLYLYDKSQWSTDATPVMYSPSWTNGVCPRTTAAADMKDAAIYVKGKIEIEGALYTTEGGAAIYSDGENAGTIEFSANAAADGNLYKKYDGTGEVAVTAAKLRNGGETGADENMTITKDVAESGDTYAYANIDGTGFKWTRLKDVDGCIIADETDPENPVYYAKPQEYVAITSNTEDESHLYHSVTGNRIFILQLMEAGCVWWEVTATATEGVYHCLTNDTYYEYDTMNEVWTEVKRTVTFYFTDPKDEAEGKSKVLTVNYGAKPDASIVSNPSKAEDAAATYQFYGWKSSETGKEYAYTAELETVTENGTYYLPIFTSITKKYTITLKDAKNSEDVPVEVFYGSVPEYTATKAATAEYTYTFDHWEPELETVTGEATYTAFWTSVKNRYTITWVDGETILEEDKNQQYGTPTEYNGEQPAKETDDNYVYAFSGWLSSLDGNTYANGETPAIGGNTTYTAQYTTTPRYAITFVNYNGTQLQKEFVTAGEHPAYTALTPARVRDVDGYYNFTGWKNLSGTFFAKDAELPAATAKETYTAQYDYVTELYTITLLKVDGTNSWSGKFGVGATPFYNKSNNDVAVTPTKKSTKSTTYTFDHWVDSENNQYALNELPAVTGEATYTAVFSSQTRKYNITFKNIDGNEETQQVIAVNYNTTAANLGTLVTPAKEDEHYTYAFTGWSPVLAKVTKAATYTAQFSETGTPRTYTITFEPENGDEAQVLHVAYGTMPQPTTPAPIDADVQYSYVFNSWYPTLTTVTEDATYYAQYTQTLNRYTVTFKDWDGTILQSDLQNYGNIPSYEGTPSKPMDLENKKKYTFTGWSPAVETVTRDVTYTAQYEENSIVASVTTPSNEMTYYASWDEAFNAANTSAEGRCTIKLYDNVTATHNTYVNKSMTFDLNGYAISCISDVTGSTLFNINSASTLTINDSQGGGVISFTGTKNSIYYAIDVHNSSATLTVNGGTIKINRTMGTFRASAVRLYNTNSTLNLYEEGTLIATPDAGDGYVIEHDGASYGKANIYGGKLKASTAIIKDRRADKNNITSGYYSKIPGTAGTDITIPSGRGICLVPDSDPAKAEGYNYKVAPGYTVTWLNDDDSQIEQTFEEAGTIPTHAEPSKSDAGQYVYKFAGWTPNVTTVTENASYTATYTLDGIVADDSEAPVEISEDMTVTTTTIETTGILKVSEGKTLTTTNLVLEASDDASGQIIEDGTITATNVYYDLKLNTEARHWHAFGVPWAVDINTNPLVEVETGRTLNISRDYEIMYYDGAERATNGPSAACWKYLRHYDKSGQPVDELVPGHGYMIAFGSHVKTVRFVKKSGAPIIYTGSVGVTAHQIGAISNPMAYHTTMDAGVGVGQVHDGGEIGHDGYDPVTITDRRFVVGKTVYIDPQSTKSVVINKAEGSVSPVAAPARRGAKAMNKKYLTLEDYYTVALTNANGEERKVYVLPEEDKEDKYVVGHDLTMMGMSDRKAQIWVNRYDENLGLNTTAPMDGVAEFPVNIYAPKAGEYTVSLVSEPDDEYTVYLTLNGEAIWNLSSSEYAVELSAGTNKSYGLRLVANKAPQTATGIDEALVDAQGDTKKVLINDQVFIIRGENVYTIDGQLVQ